MEKLGRKRQETKKRILMASEAYFTDYGFKETLISDIARHVHLDRRTIYRYFPSKESLLINITARLWDEFMEEVEAVSYDDCIDAFDKFEKLVTFYFDYISLRPKMIQFLGMIDVYVGTNMYDRDEFEELDQHGKRMDRMLEKIIKEGQETGVLKKQFSAHDYAVTINNSLVALATRTAIYLPNTILHQQGYVWKLLQIQAKLMLDSIKA